MAAQLDQATRDALMERVRFYRDLGLTEFYRRPVEQLLATAEAGAEPHHTAVQSLSEAPGGAPLPVLKEETLISARKPLPSPPRRPPLSRRPTAPPLSWQFAKRLEIAPAAHCMKGATNWSLAMGRRPRG